MNKMIKKLLSVVLVGAFFLTTVITVQAREVGYQKVDKLYISSLECPADYKEYVKTKIDNIIMSIEPSELINVDTVAVGTPFSFSNEESDIFYFPILCNNEIAYLLRVFPKEEGDYGWILGKTLVNELNELARNSSEDIPLILSMENNSVIATVGKVKRDLIKYPIDMEMNNIVNANKNSDSPVIASGKTLSTVLATEIDSDINYSVKATSLLKNTRVNIASITSAPTFKYLALSLIEQQGEEELWCAAYASAAIIRYVEGSSTSPRAYDVMRYHFDNPAETDHIGENEVAWYANSRLLFPELAQVLPSDILMTEISENKPVYLRMRRTVSGNHHYHAIVLRGYSQTTNTWSIWNPWELSYETFEIGSTYVPVGNQTREYTYYQTLYRWE